MAKRGRKNKLLMEERLAEIEQRLIRMRSYYAVEQWIVANYGIGDRQARRLIDQVKTRWRAEAKEDDREVLRRDAHQTLQLVMSMAMNRTQVVKDGDGNPLLDPATTQLDANGKVVAGKPLVRANPDLQRVLHGLSQYRALHGLDETVKVKVEFDGDVSIAKEISSLSNAGLDALKQALLELAPDGDIGKLVGDWLGGGAPKE